MTAETIAKVLELSGLTTRQFADKIATSPKTVRRWVTGTQEPGIVSRKLLRYYFKELFKRVENGND